MSNDDFKFAIKKLVHIYYNKIKYIVIEKNLTYFFSKSILNSFNYFAYMLNY